MNHFIETVLLITHNISFGWESMKKKSIMHSYLVAAVNSYEYVFGMTISLPFVFSVLEQSFIQVPIQRGGTEGPDPPWKITSYMGFYRE